MPVDSIKAPTNAMDSVSVSSIIGVIQGVCSLFIVIGFIVGIIYMIKSKKTKEKRLLIGTIIITAPLILYWILCIVRFYMSINM